MTCPKCWNDGGRPVEVAKDDVVHATGVLCDGCIDKAHVELAVLRQEFDALIAAGVSRESANAMMIAKIDGVGAAA